jgi:putative NADH-flavin reductase
MKDFIIEHWEKISIPISIIAGAVTGRKLKASTDKKAAAEAKNSELENLGIVREAEKELISDMRTHLTALAEINDELKKIIADKDKVIKEYKIIISRQKANLNKCKKSCGL